MSAFRACTFTSAVNVFLDAASSSAHGLQKVFRRQPLAHARDLKTLPGDTEREGERLALGFEPDLRKRFSPVLQGRPLFRGGLFRKVHSAPPPGGPTATGDEVVG